MGTSTDRLKRAEGTDKCLEEEGVREEDIEVGPSGCPEASFHILAVLRVIGPV